MLAHTQSPRLEMSEEASYTPLLGRLPWTTILCVLVGLTTPFLMRMAGNFPVAEWFLLGSAAIMIVLRALHHRWPDGAARTRWFTGLVVLQLIGLCAYIVSDLYRGSVSADYLRGWARMAFVAIDLIGLAGLFGSSWRRFVFFVGGFAIGQAASAVCFGPLYGNWWKFGFAAPVTYLAFIAVGRQGRFLSSVFALALGLLHLALDFRSLGLECLLVGVALNLTRISRGWQLVSILVGCIALALAMGGLFADKSTARFASHRSDAERQAMMEVAAEAFAESPFIGQGSWFSATTINSRIEARYILLSDTFNGYSEETERDLAVHSQLLTALAEGGLFGASFFFAYTTLLLWALSYCLRSDHIFQALVFMFLIEALTNVAIAPFSGPARVQIAAAAVLGLLLWQQARGRLDWEGVHA